jgi:predicted unusual protein kinase regulating ubiquinone biosynthesis (AarF/ABC1/UbiB family)
MSGIYGEIKRVLQIEMDYKEEVNKQIEFRKFLVDYPSFYVPRVYSELSNQEVIVSEYIEGHNLGELANLSLSQVERNQLGRELLSLFYLEIFKGHLIQTDCHAGNFIVTKMGGDYKLVLIDFGASIFYDESVLVIYQKILRSIFNQQRRDFFITLNSITEKNGGEYEMDPDLIWDYCLMAGSPMRSEDFDWGSTDLADQLYLKSLELIKKSHIEKPPHQFIFLDRKLLGIFSLLKSLKCRFNVKELVSQFISP